VSVFPKLTDDLKVGILLVHIGVSHIVEVTPALLAIQDQKVKVVQFAFVAQSFELAILDFSNNF
jgi:hypothetical protein